MTSFLENILDSHRGADRALGSTNSRATIRSALQLQPDQSIYLEMSDAWDLPLIIDENLLANAFREIFSGARARLSFAPISNPPAEWPAETYLVFSIEGIDVSSPRPESLAIVRHVFEWYGGGFWQGAKDFGGLYFALPKAPHGNKAAA